jgi:hypothetical protein
VHIHDAHAVALLVIRRRDEKGENEADRQQNRGAAGEPWQRVS